MSTPARVTKSVPSPSPTIRGRHRVASSITRSHAATPIAQAPEQKRARAASDPLWVITIGMGAFFAAVALIMMFD
jgi:hypothetical protein